jgi:hypothetical protein
MHQQITSLLKNEEKEKERGEGRREEGKNGGEKVTVFGICLYLEI